MPGTFLCPNTCGFAKVIALEADRETSRLHLKRQNESSTCYKARVKSEEYKLFQNYFTETRDGKMDVSFGNFCKNLPALRNTINKWNTRKLEQKKTFLQAFSKESWAKLTLAKKREHTFVNCKSCAVRYASEQASFPVRSPRLKGKAKMNPVFAANQEAQRLRNNFAKTKPTKTNAKSAARDIFQAIAPRI